MPKKLSNDLKYIAPGIQGGIRDNGSPYIFDELNVKLLDLHNVDHKIIIYERQVKGWFLNRATRLLRGKNNGFIILMICFGYLEGVEQYRRDEESNSSSRGTFSAALKRLYPDRFEDADLYRLYSDARCGLFHDGMVRDMVVYSYDFEEAIEFPDEITIKINPKLLLNDIKQDFNQYIRQLKDENENISRDNFNSMYNLL